MTTKFLFEAIHGRHRDSTTVTCKKQIQLHGIKVSSFGPVTQQCRWSIMLRQYIIANGPFLRKKICKSKQPFKRLSHCLLSVLFNGFCTWSKI